MKTKGALKRNYLFCLKPLTSQKSKASLFCLDFVQKIRKNHEKYQPDDALKTMVMVSA